MAVDEGILNIKGLLYDMTGAASYAVGTSLGKFVADGTKSVWERELDLFITHQHGGTPTLARIIGEKLVLECTLGEYSPDVINVWAQRHRPSGATQNYHFLEGATYKLGHILKSDDLIRLMIRDEDNPTTKPALYLPACVVTRIGPFSHTRDTEHASEVRLEITALYDDDIGSVGLYGDYTLFPTIPSP